MNVLLNIVPEVKSCFLQVGNIKITVKSGKRAYFVNKHRIRKDELESVIKKSLAFEDQESYDSFVKDTSNVNLRLQKVLEDGIVRFALNVDRTEDCSIECQENKMLLAIPVLRKKNKNYVRIRNKLFIIKNQDALFNLENGKYLEQYGGYLQKPSSN